MGAGSYSGSNLNQMTSNQFDAKVQDIEQWASLVSEGLGLGGGLANGFSSGLSGGKSVYNTSPRPTVVNKDEPEIDRNASWKDTVRDMEV